MPNCRDCKHYWKDIDLPHPVCRLHEFHFEQDFTPCEDFEDINPQKPAPVPTMPTTGYRRPAASAAKAKKESGPALSGGMIAGICVTGGCVLLALLVFAVYQFVFGGGINFGDFGGFGTASDSGQDAVVATVTPEESTTTTTTSPEYVIPEVDPDTMILARVTSSNGLFLRMAPNTSAKTVTAMPYDARVTILHIEGGWCYVEYKGYAGWCASEFLEEEHFTTTTTQPSQATHVYPGKAKVTSDNGINLRQGPSTNDKIITAMPYNATVTIITVDGGWCYVEYKGKMGWCTAEFLEMK